MNAALHGIGEEKDLRLEVKMASQVIAAGAGVFFLPSVQFNGARAGGLGQCRQCNCRSGFAGSARAQGASKGQDVAVVIVPGWLSGVSQYASMAAHLRCKGFTTSVVPLRWYNWLPSLGGRSVRPILDRIDAAISLASQALSPAPTDADEDRTAPGNSAQDEDLPKYTFLDFLREFSNPKNGAHPRLLFGELDESASAVQQDLALDSRRSGMPPRKVVLVAHSAGGWICRILLGRRVPYDGKIYGAAHRVKGLITLGTPHICTDRLTKKSMDFVNTNYPGAAEKGLGVEYVCIAGKCLRGSSKYGGLWKDFTYQSYELCCGSGDVWGDGVTPVQCAVGLDGAEHIILEGVEHFPANDENSSRKWYGTSEVVDAWIPALLKMATPLSPEAASTS